MGDLALEWSPEGTVFFLCTWGDRVHKAGVRDGLQEGSEVTGLFQTVPGTRDTRTCPQVDDGLEGTQQWLQESYEDSTEVS